ncbi:HutD family protein [Myroides sp. M-43]|uniref:HutD family protein n=1 Tax=Myroides oncorhynchi TaxID=2893756 RepID=UPI001E4EB459|nr:HutD family protein [Myroides oncorhynchi]MCC9044445.1 HutD family protein [Myroides oncorhynchi]
MNIEVIRKEEVASALWTGGQTQEYSIYPKGAVYADRDFLFRISSATIESIPSEFTRFDGYRRYLVMLEGDLNLVINDKKEYYANNALFAFSSSDKITSYSKGKDFNLMLHHSIIDETVMVSDASFSIKHRVLCIFAIERSQITLNQEVYSLERYDCLLVDNKELEIMEIQLSQEAIIAYW